jgi:hypothetical protein
MTSLFKPGRFSATAQTSVIYFGEPPVMSIGYSRARKAAELPIQLPTKFELSINLKTAQFLGIHIPPAILIRADQVIE